MSAIAKSGNRAEMILCTQLSVRVALEKYFKNSIKKITKLHGLKSDHFVEFDDGTHFLLQNKNGLWGGRGHSIDRRPVNMMSPDETARKLIAYKCLKQGEEGHMDKTESMRILWQSLIGDIEWAPTHFCHTVVKDDSITELFICTTDELLDQLKNEIYETAVPKRTCVHLSPCIYLQRKGGGKSDSRPDDIQTKLKLNASFKPLFTQLM